MKKKIKIAGEEFTIGPMTLGVRHWIQTTYKNDQDWNKKCAEQNVEVLAESCHKLLDANGREKYKTAKDLYGAMLGNTNYLFLLYVKIASIYGLSFPDVEKYDMENVTDKEIAEVNKAMEALLPKIEESKKKPVSETTDKNP